MSGDVLFPALEAAERAQVAEAFARKDAIVARLREREADFTPRLVARSVVEAVLRLRIHKHAGATALVGSEYTAWPAIGLAKCKAWIGGFLLRGDGDLARYRCDRDCLVRRPRASSRRRLPRC